MLRYHLCKKGGEIYTCICLQEREQGSWRILEDLYYIHLWNFKVVNHVNITNLKTKVPFVLCKTNFHLFPSPSFLFVVPPWMGTALGKLALLPLFSYFHLSPLGLSISQHGLPFHLCHTGQTVCPCLYFIWRRLWLPWSADTQHCAAGHLDGIPPCLLFWADLTKAISMGSSFSFSSAQSLH